MTAQRILPGVCLDDLAFTSLTAAIHAVNACLSHAAASTIHQPSTIPDPPLHPLSLHSQKESPPLQSIADLVRSLLAFSIRVDSNLSAYCCTTSVPLFCSCPGRLLDALSSAARDPLAPLSALIHSPFRSVLRSTPDSARRQISPRVRFFCLTARQRSVWVRELIVSFTDLGSCCLNTGWFALH